MNYPSVKRLQAIKDVTPAIARQIRQIMRREVPIPCGGCGLPDAAYACRFYHDGRCRPSRLKAIDRLIGTFGVEYQAAGHNAKSPAFHYCNAGDTYDTTILKVGDRFVVGCWGDIIEHGRYD